MKSVQTLNCSPKDQVKISSNVVQSTELGVSVDWTEPECFSTHSVDWNTPVQSTEFFQSSALWFYVTNHNTPPWYKITSIHSNKQLSKPSLISPKSQSQSKLNYKPNHRLQVMPLPTELHHTKPVSKMFVIPQRSPSCLCGFSKSTPVYHLTWAPYTIGLSSIINMKTPV